MKSNKKYLPAAAVKNRYGKCSDMWLWRRLNDDSGFPKPALVIATRRLWDEEELDAWDATQLAPRVSLRRRPSAASPATSKQQPLASDDAGLP